MRVFHPAFGHEIGLSAVELSTDPDTQVAQVVNHLMRPYSETDGLTPELRSDAMRASSPDDPLTGNFFDLKRRIRFVQDEHTGAPFSSWLKGPVIETLVRPIDLRLMREPQGDCDDFAMTMRARLIALGIPSAFCTTAVDWDDPTRFSHVYAVAYCDSGACGPYWSGRVALDASHGPYPGWECPNPFDKRKDWGGPDSFFLAGLLLITAGLAILWASSRAVR